MIHRAIESQQQIGFIRFITGFMSIEWHNEVRACHGVEYPNTCMEVILLLLCDHLCKPVWKGRNQLFHNSIPGATTAEQQLTAERLTWYHRFQNEILDYRHWFIIDYHIDEINKMSRDMWRSQLMLLDNAQQSYKTECKQTTKGQTVIP